MQISFITSPWSMSSRLRPGSRGSTGRGESVENGRVSVGHIMRRLHRVEPESGRPAVDHSTLAARPVEPDREPVRVEGRGPSTRCTSRESSTRACGRTRCNIRLARPCRARPHSDPGPAPRVAYRRGRRYGRAGPSGRCASEGMQLSALHRWDSAGGIRTHDFGELVRRVVCYSIPAPESYGWSGGRATRTLSPAR